MRDTPEKLFITVALAVAGLGIRAADAFSAFFLLANHIKACQTGNDQYDSKDNVVDHRYNYLPERANSLFRLLFVRAISRQMMAVNTATAIKPTMAPAMLNAAGYQIIVPMVFTK